VGIDSAKWMNRWFPFRKVRTSPLTPRKLIDRFLYIPDIVASSEFLSKDSRNGDFGTFVVGASVRGHAHYMEGTPRQDSFSIFSHKGWSFLILSDGVSSSSMSHFGSNFLTNHAIQAIQHTFSDVVNFEVDSWKQICRSLSRSLVGYFEASTFSEESSESLIPSERRIQASKYLASTLEVLAIRQERSANFGVNYRHIRLAGDCTVIEVDSLGSMQLVTASTAKGVNGFSLVKALPVSDSDPEITSGIIGLGSSLLFMTDGAASLVMESKRRKQELLSEVLHGQLQADKLLEIFSQQPDVYLDDRSILVVKNCQLA
jgi:serine/threonine protein phosphatase PrpC